MKIQESAENYLETILMLKEEKGLVRSIDIVHRLDFSKPSISRAMSLLRENGYVVMDQDGFLVLTDLGRGVAEDKEQAAALYRRAAEQGYAYAQCNLGFCCLHGIGVEKDETEAVAWLERAAEQGHPRALYLLGDCRWNGRGTAQNDEGAAECFRRAAERDFPPAVTALGRCCALGRGVPLDREKAAECYRRAASLGDRDAVRALQELRAAARKPQEPPKKGGLLGLLKKFKGK